MNRRRIMFALGMGRPRSSGGRLVGWTAACLAAAFLLMSGAASASTALYVGDAEEYSLAFKAEAAELYVMQFAGMTDCYYTEPHEDVGSGGFTAFPAPKLMRSEPNGLVAEESFGDDFGGGYAQVRAVLDGGAVAGDFSFDESSASFHCDTGFTPVPFITSRYESIMGQAAAAAPAPGEVPVYYGNEAPIEIFLRTTGKQAGGIRGTFVPQCPLGGRGVIPARRALFADPVAAKRGKQGGFRERVVEHGRKRSGAEFKEVISIAGRIERDAVVGNYLRVRIDRPGRAAAQRCVTGPIPFRAVRYLPAAG